MYALRTKMCKFFIIVKFLDTLYKTFVYNFYSSNSLYTMYTFIFMRIRIVVWNPVQDS